MDSQELLKIYKAGYDQLTALKHIVFSSIHLYDPESLAVFLSQQINEKMNAKKNALWLMDDAQKAVEIVRDGKIVKRDKRRILEIEPSEVLKRVVHDQLVAWPPSSSMIKEVFSNFKSPTLFPIKGKDEALGFLVLDPEESMDVEIYQFFGQFAALIMNISNLHHKVKDQKKGLDEITKILFKQNEQLSSLYHVQLNLLKATDPIQLFNIVVEAVMDDLGACRAAAFVIDDSSRELRVAAKSSGFNRVDTLRLRIDKIRPIKQAIESGRIVTSKHYPEKLYLESTALENWAIFCLKGSGQALGILIVEVEDGDINDSISILINCSTIALENILLHKMVASPTSYKKEIAR